MEKEILLAPARGFHRDQIFVPVLFWGALVRLAMSEGAPELDSLWPPYDCKCFARAVRAGLARLDPNAKGLEPATATLFAEENQPLVRAVLAMFDGGDGVSVQKVHSRAVRAIPSRYRSPVA